MKDISSWEWGHMLIITATRRSWGWWIALDFEFWAVVGLKPVGYLTLSPASVWWAALEEEESLASQAGKLKQVKASILVSLWTGSMNVPCTSSLGKNIGTEYLICYSFCLWLTLNTFTPMFISLNPFKSMPTSDSLRKLSNDYGNPLNPILIFFSLKSMPSLTS